MSYFSPSIFSIELLVQEILPLERHNARNPKEGLRVQIIYDTENNFNLQYNQDIDAGAGRVFFVTKQARCIQITKGESTVLIHLKKFFSEQSAFPIMKAQEVLLCNPSMAANFQVKYLIAIHQIKKCEPVEVSETQKVQSNAGSQTEKIQHNSESTQTHAPTNDATTTVQPRNVAIQTTDFIYDNVATQTEIEIAQTQTNSLVPHTFKRRFKQLVLELFALLIHRFCLKASNIYKSHRKLKSDVISRATATDLSFPVCLTRNISLPSIKSTILKERINQLASLHGNLVKSSPAKISSAPKSSKPKEKLLPTKAETKVLHTKGLDDEQILEEKHEFTPSPIDSGASDLQSLSESKSSLKSYVGTPKSENSKSTSSKSSMSSSSKTTSRSNTSATSSSTHSKSTSHTTSSSKTSSTATSRKSSSKKNKSNFSYLVRQRLGPVMLGQNQIGSR